MRRAAWLGVVCCLAWPLAASAQDGTGSGQDTGGTGTAEPDPGAPGANPPAGTNPPPPASPPPPQVIVVRDSAPPPAAPRDEGRHPFFYLEGGIGYSYIDLRAFDDSNFLPAVARHSG